MSVPQLEIARSVVCYSLMIWFCFLSQNLASSARYIALHMYVTLPKKKSTAKTKLLHFSRYPDQYLLQVNGVTLKHVEKFKYLWVSFTSDGKQDEKLDTRIGKASAVMRALHKSVVMNQKLSKKAKLSMYEQLLSPFSSTVMNLR